MAAILVSRDERTFLSRWGQQWFLRQHGRALPEPLSSGARTHARHGERVAQRSRCASRFPLPAADCFCRKPVLSGPFNRLRLLGASDLKPWIDGWRNIYRRAVG